MGTGGRWIAHERSWIRSHLLLLLNEDAIYFGSPCILESVFLVRKSESGWGLGGGGGPKKVPGKPETVPAGDAAAGMVELHSSAASV